MTDCERECVSVKKDTEILTSGWWEYRNMLMVNIFLNCYKLSMIMSITFSRKTDIDKATSWLHLFPLQPLRPLSSPPGSRGPASLNGHSTSVLNGLCPLSPHPALRSSRLSPRGPKHSLRSSPDQPPAPSLGSLNSWTQVQSHSSSHDVRMETVCLPISKQHVMCKDWMCFHQI